MKVGGTVEEERWRKRFFQFSFPVHVGKYLIFRKMPLNLSIVKSDDAMAAHGFDWVGYAEHAFLEGG